MKYDNMTNEEFIEFIVENLNTTTKIKSPIKLKTSEAKNKFNNFAIEENKIKDIIIDLNFNHIKNRFEIYETEDYYVLKIIEKNYNIGTPGYETIMSDNEKIYILIESKKWGCYNKKINHFGLELNLCLYDPELNKIKYLLNKEIAKEQFENFEYRDIGWKYDSPNYNKMYYEQL
jgi:hypothetical protein